MKVMPRPPAVQRPALADTTSHLELLSVGVISIQISSLAFVCSILSVSWAATGAQRAQDVDVAVHVVQAFEPQRWRC